MLLRDAQQCDSRALRLASPLLPILQGAHTNAHQACKSGLREIQLLPNLLRRGRLRKLAGAQYQLPVLELLDLGNAVKDFCLPVALV
jgi:hypothetical protein